MAVRLVFYDGLDCIGGNKILLEDGDTAVFLDFGTNFRAEGAFFDEFLRPRAICGLADLLELGLLPPLKGAYREDLEIAERRWWDKLGTHPLYREVECRGVLFSHAHVDHCGYLGYLNAAIPVYTTLTTALIMKAMQDTGRPELSRESCYLVPREVDEEHLLRSSDWRRVAATQRQYFIMGTSTLAPAALDFWQRAPAARSLAPTPPKVGGERVGDLELRFWPVDHSVPGAAAIGVRTAGGWVVYTGDLRLHGARAAATRAFMQEAARLAPAVLICEGTRPRVEKPVKEEEVLQRACEALREVRGLVVADFGPRNVERLLSFLCAAREAGRRLAVLPKDAYLLEALHNAGEPGVPHPFEEEAIVLYVEAKVQRDRWERELLRRYREKRPDKLINAGTVARDPDGYVLCFSYYELHELIDIGVHGGTYLYSSCEPFNEEMRIDFAKMLAWVRHFGLTFLGGEDSHLHASGHIHGPGLEELVETLRPRILVPVHTEDRDFFRRFAGTCRVVFPARGESLSLG